MASSARWGGNTFAHEIAHAAGCLDDVTLQDTKGNSAVKHRLMYSYVPTPQNLNTPDPFAGHYGLYLTADERKWLRYNAQYID